MKKFIIFLLLNLFILVSISFSEDIEGLKNAFLKQKQNIDDVIDNNNMKIKHLMNDWEKILNQSMYESSWDSTFDIIYGQPGYGSRRAHDRQDKQNRTEDKIETIKSKIEELKTDNEQLKIKKGDLELKVIETFGSLPD